MCQNSFTLKPTHRRYNENVVSSTNILVEIVLNVTETFFFSESENQIIRKQQKIVPELLLCFYTQLFSKTNNLFLKQLNRNYKNQDIDF